MHRKRLSSVKSRGPLDEYDIVIRSTEPVEPGGFEPSCSGFTGRGALQSSPVVFMLFVEPFCVAVESNAIGPSLFKVVSSKALERQSKISYYGPMKCAGSDLNQQWGL